MTTEYEWNIMLNHVSPTIENMTRTDDKTVYTKKYFSVPVYDLFYPLLFESDRFHTEISAVRLGFVFHVHSFCLFGLNTT